MYKKCHGIILMDLTKTYQYYVNKSLFKREKKSENAVSKISFEVGAGEILGIVGPNGAGKTTLIKMIAGVMKPDSGTVLVNDINPFYRKKEYRMDVSIVLGQKGKMHPDMSIYESAKLYGSMYKLTLNEILKRVQEIAEELRLEIGYLSKQVRTLSLGQRMKGELCIALINRPSIIFLDEPTLGLDSRSSKAIRTYLVSYCKKNRASIILTSHDIKDIETTCEKLFILNQGKMVYYGEMNQLPKQFLADTIIEFSVNESVILLSEKNDRIKIEKDKAIIGCREEEKEELISYIYSSANIQGLVVKPKELEDMIEEIIYETN